MQATQQGAPTRVDEKLSDRSGIDHLDEDLGDRRDMFDLAGWLFADLLIGLTLLFSALGGFGGSVVPGFAIERTPGPSVEPTGIPDPKLIYASAICLAFSGVGQQDGVLDAGAQKKISDRLDGLRELFGSNEAALVLTFGHDKRLDPKDGTRMAHNVNVALAARRPPFSRETRFRDYIDVEPDPPGQEDNKVFIEIFFRRPIEPLRESGCPPETDLH